MKNFYGFLFVIFMVSSTLFSMDHYERLRPFDIITREHYKKIIQSKGRYRITDEDKTSNSIKLVILNDITRVTREQNHSFYRSILFGSLAFLTVSLTMRSFLKGLPKFLEQIPYAKALGAVTGIILTGINLKFTYDNFQTYKKKINKKVRLLELRDILNNVSSTKN